jgi:hypothetical protein
MPWVVSGALSLRPSSVDICTALLVESLPSSPASTRYQHRAAGSSSMCLSLNIEEVGGGKGVRRGWLASDDISALLLVPISYTTDILFCLNQSFTLSPRPTASTSVQSGRYHHHVSEPLRTSCAHITYCGYFCVCIIQSLTLRPRRASLISDQVGR